VCDDKAAHRSKRQSLDVLILRAVLTDAIRARARRYWRTNGERADTIGGDEITLEQRRRRTEHVGDVVEPER
jgi:hypothetical protein